MSSANYAIIAAEGYASCLSVCQFCISPRGRNVEKNFPRWPKRLPAAALEHVLGSSVVNTTVSTVHMLVDLIGGRERLLLATLITPVRTTPTRDMIDPYSLSWAPAGGALWQCLNHLRGRFLLLLLPCSFHALLATGTCLRGPLWTCWAALFGHQRLRWLQSWHLKQQTNKVT